MSAVASPVCGNGAPPTVRGFRRNKMSTIAVSGRAGKPAPTCAAAVSIDSRSFFVPTIDRGVSANGNWVNGPSAGSR